MKVEHTPGHLNSPACARAYAMLVTPFSASMRFAEASAAFLAARAIISSRGRIQYVSPRTFKDYEADLRMVGKFFAELPLNQIHAGHLRAYQVARASGDGFTRHVKRAGVEFDLPTMAGAAAINDELGLLKRIMTLAAAWTPELNAMYLPLQEMDTELPKSLSPVEQEHFLRTAAANPAWHGIWCYALVALNTTFSSDEMRTLRQGDVNLPQQILSVNKRYGKNPLRRRTVPIEGADCLFALERLLERSIVLVGEGPQFYLFPFRHSRGHYDGERPVSPTGLRKDFEAVRAKAGVPWFTINGLRHTAITRMAEQGVSIGIIMNRAGHMSPKMTAHYTHISEQAERMAMKQMFGRRPVVSIQAPRRRRIMA